MKNVNFPAATYYDITGGLTGGGVETPLDNSSFVAGSIVYKDGTSESDEITVGAAIISSLTFELMNDNYQFEDVYWSGATVWLQLEADGQTVRFETMHVVKHQTLGRTIYVECYDGLKEFDEHVLGESNIWWRDDTWAYADEAVEDLASYRGYSVRFSVSGNTHIRIPRPDNDRMTERSFLSYCAQLMGCYVQCNNNTLYFRWYSMSQAYDAGMVFSHNLETDNVYVSGVHVYSYDDESEYLIGDYSGVMLQITDNPLIVVQEQTDTEDTEPDEEEPEPTVDPINNIEEVAENIAEAVIGMEFRSGTAAVCSNPAIEAGDLINIETSVEADIPFLVTSLTWKSSTAQETLEADADPYETDARYNRKTYVKDTAKQTVEDMLNDPESALAQAIAAAGCQCNYKDSETVYW